MKDKNLSYKINISLKSKRPFLCSRNVAEKKLYFIFMKRGRFLVLERLYLGTCLVHQFYRKGKYNFNSNFYVLRRKLYKNKFQVHHMNLASLSDIWSSFKGFLQYFSLFFPYMCNLLSIAATCRTSLIMLKALKQQQTLPLKMSKV